MNNIPEPEEGHVCIECLNEAGLSPPSTAMMPSHGTCCVCGVNYKRDAIYLCNEAETTVVRNRCDSPAPRIGYDGPRARAKVLSALIDHADSVGMDRYVREFKAAEAYEINHAGTSAQAEYIVQHAGLSYVIRNLLHKVFGDKAED